MYVNILVLKVKDARNISQMSFEVPEQHQSKVRLLALKNHQDSIYWSIHKQHISEFQFASFP